MSTPGVRPEGATAAAPTSAGLPAAPPPMVNAANALTLLRLLLVPVFAVVLLHGSGAAQDWRLAACGIFALASVTDRIDGDLARRWHMVTELGKIADPIADKALVGAALLGLSLLGELPWWVTLVVLGRELGVTLLRFWVIRHGVIAASRGGKLKTLLQAIAIGLYLLPLTGWLTTGRAFLMGAAVVVTLVTGVDYLARALTLRKTSARALRQRAAAARSRRQRPAAP